MDLYRRLRSNKVEYKLSILILSLPNRVGMLSELLTSIKNQSINKPVQILYLGDNKSMTVGEKRNFIMSYAKGRYITFIDDDDKVSDDYIDSILSAIEENPEVVTFTVQRYKNSKEDKQFKYYSDNGRSNYLSPDKSHYKMLPNHLCVWRKDIIGEDFPHKSLSEDHQWAESMANYYSSVHNIDKVLYHYFYDSQRSETHRR